MYSSCCCCAHHHVYSLPFYVIQERLEGVAAPSLPCLVCLAAIYAGYPFLWTVLCWVATRAFTAPLLLSTSCLCVSLPLASIVLLHFKAVASLASNSSALMTSPLRVTSSCIAWVGRLAITVPCFLLSLSLTSCPFSSWIQRILLMFIPGMIHLVAVQISLITSPFSTAFPCLMFIIRGTPGTLTG